MGAKYIFITLLILLVACESYVQTVPTSQYKPPVENISTQPTQDACAAVTCLVGQDCVNGKCVCPTGKKFCGDDCISTSACCTNNDCDKGECLNGKCVEQIECAYGEESVDGKCECNSESYYCPEQKKCVQKGDCCFHGNCKSFERCVPTNWRATLCVKIEEKKVCRLLADNSRTDYYEVKGSTFRIGATNWWNDGGITFNISNEAARIGPNQTITFQNASIFHEGIQTTGGYCEEDEED